MGPQLVSVRTSHPSAPTGRLEFITGPTQPVLAVIDGVPTYAVVQDLIPQRDMLSQALQEVGLLNPLAVTPTPSSEDSSSTQSSTSLESEDDTLAFGAERVLRWLESHEIPPDSDDSATEQEDNDDSRRAASRPAGPPYQPVRQSLPPPSVNWDRLGDIVGYYPPADPANLNIKCAKNFVVNNTPPRQDQLPVLRDAVTSMLASGVIETTTRGPFLNPIQVVPKNETEGRFVLNYSALTPHLQAPRFQLPPLPVVLPS